MKVEIVIQNRDILYRKLEQLRDSVFKSAKDWGSILVRSMYESAHSSGIKPFTGRFYESGIKFYKIRKKVFRLKIIGYGINLDNMDPHKEKIDRRRTLFIKWGLQADSDRIRKKFELLDFGMIDRFNIDVKPHHYIRRGFRKARPYLDNLIVANGLKYLQK